MEKRQHLRPALWIVLGVVSLWLLSAVTIPFVWSDWPERGQVGDMFGAVNSLFSGLALAGIVYAILLQRQELELQRKELQLTRDELRRTAEAQERAEKSLAEQVRNQMVAAQIQGLAVLISHLDQAKDTSAQGKLMGEYYQLRSDEYVDKIKELLRIE